MTEQLAGTEQRCGDVLINRTAYNDAEHTCALPAGHEGRHSDGLLTWAQPRPPRGRKR